MGICRKTARSANGEPTLHEAEIEVEHPRTVNTGKDARQAVDPRTRTLLEKALDTPSRRGR
jgi:hypothetical protein